MERAAFDPYVKDRYQNQIDWYDKKAIQNRKRYKVSKTVIIVLSFSVPIVIALSYDFSRIVSIALSSIVAVLSAFVAAFKFYENWVNYRTTCESLISEKHCYDFGIGPYKGCGDREALFVDRIEGLISGEHTKWLALEEEGKKP